MPTIGHVRRAAFVGLISFAMVATAGLAAAQEDTSSTSGTTSESTESQSTESQAPEVAEQDTTEETTPAPAPERPLVSVVADCYDGFKSLVVRIQGADGVTYEVTLAPAGGGAGVTETSHEQDGKQVALFDGPRPGSYVVTVVGADGSEGGSEVTVEKCSSLKPGDPVLTVSVKCVNDLGTMFIRVANPGNGEVRTFAVDIDDVELLDGLRLSGGFFVDIVEQDFEDGTYTVAVLDEEGETVASQEVTVACAPVPPTTTTTTAPPATTTTPPAQGGTAPSGGLASTGAAVGGLAVLGLVVLALGAGLVLIGRRRRTTPE